MLNHLTKILIIFVISLVLLACHKPPVLDKNLALSILNEPQNLSGYSVIMETNNPSAHGKSAKGWRCEDKQALIDAGLVSCKTSGRSAIYLEFSAEGEKLIVGHPFGDKTLRKVNVIAVRQTAQKINSIKMLDKTHATVSFERIYFEHTLFSNDLLKKQIPLNLPHIVHVNLTLIDKKWGILKPVNPSNDE